MQAYRSPVGVTDRVEDQVVRALGEPMRVEKDRIDVVREGAMELEAFRLRHLTVPSARHLEPSRDVDVDRHE